MITVSKYERSELERVGLLKSKKNGFNPQDANYVIGNPHHKSRKKKTYVTEEPDIMLFLEKYDNLDLQKITPIQLKKLIDEKMLGESKIQRHGEYKPGAIAFVDRFGQCRIKKVSRIMIFLNLWKNN